MEEQGKKVEELLFELTSMDDISIEKVQAVEKIILENDKIIEVPLELVLEESEPLKNASSQTQAAPLEFNDEPSQQSSAEQEIDQAAQASLALTEKTEGVTKAEMAAATSGKHSEDARSLVQKANLPQKIKLAMFGNATCRLLLIRESNRMIQEFVLKNPRMQPKEIEEFSRNPNLSQYVLRKIADNQVWMKSYVVKVNLVMNPKTPADISLKWLKHLNMSEVRKIAKSKNVPQVVSVMAKKKVADAESKH